MHVSVSSKLRPRPRTLTLLCLQVQRQLQQSLNAQGTYVSQLIAQQRQHCQGATSAHGAPLAPRLEPPPALDMPDLESSSIWQLPPMWGDLGDLQGQLSPALQTQRQPQLDFQAPDQLQQQQPHAQLQGGHDQEQALPDLPDMDLLLNAASTPGGQGGSSTSWAQPPQSGDSSLDAPLTVRNLFGDPSAELRQHSKLQHQADLRRQSPTASSLPTSLCRACLAGRSACQLHAGLSIA